MSQQVGINRTAITQYGILVFRLLPSPNKGLVAALELAATEMVLSSGHQGSDKRHKFFYIITYAIARRHNIKNSPKPYRFEHL